MALWEGYIECLQDLVGRSDHYKCLRDYLQAHEEFTKPETSKHLLSIGAGTGELDHGLVGLLPNLTSYIAVEPHVKNIDALKGKLEDFTGIEKQYVNGMMETYTGPPHGADIILMSHVGYFFSDCFEQQIGRALSWLKEGGRILLIQSEDTMHDLIYSTFGVDRVDDVACHLRNMDVNFAESIVDSTLDMSSPGPTYYGFLSLMLKHRATNEEVDKALAVLKPLFIPGTKKLRISDSLFVIQNANPKK